MRWEVGEANLSMMDSWGVNADTSDRDVESDHDQRDVESDHDVRDVGNMDNLGISPTGRQRMRRRLQPHVT